MFLDASEGGEGAMVFDLVCLDWFAEKLDEFSKSNMLNSDVTVAAILHEWKSYFRFNPVIYIGGKA